MNYDERYNRTYHHTSYSGGAGISGTVLLIYLVVIVFLLVCNWQVFKKAGQAGWKSIVPFYNTWTLIKIVNRPGWWFLLFFIPLVNIVTAIVIAIDLAKSFGKSTAFGVFGLVIFFFVGYPLLAFGSAKYKMPVR